MVHNGAVDLDLPALNAQPSEEGGAPHRIRRHCTAEIVGLRQRQLQKKQRIPQFRNRPMFHKTALQNGLLGALLTLRASTHRRKLLGQGVRISANGRGALEQGLLGPQEASLEDTHKMPEHAHKMSICSRASSRRPCRNSAPVWAGRSPSLVSNSDRCWRQIWHTFGAKAGPIWTQRVVSNWGQLGRCWAPASRNCPQVVLVSFV